MLARLRSRLMALGLLLVVLLAAHGFIVEPLWIRYQDNKAAIAQQQDLYQRYVGISQGRRDLELQLGELEQREAASGGYLPGASDTLAAADLQNRLKSLLSDSGGKLKSMQNIPAVEVKSLLRITVRVQLTADTDALQQILYGLESDTPYLFVDNVDIRKVTSRSRRRRSSAPAPAANDNLQIRFDVYGYMRAPEA